MSESQAPDSQPVEKKEVPPDDIDIAFEEMLIKNPKQPEVKDSKPEEESQPKPKAELPEEVKELKRKIAEAQVGG